MCNRPVQGRKKLRKQTDDCLRITHRHGAVVYEAITELSNPINKFKLYAMLGPIYMLYFSCVKCYSSHRNLAGIT